MLEGTPPACLAGIDPPAVGYLPAVTPDLLERYADLIVSVGANVQPGQVVAVEALPEAQPLVHAIARRAYEKGARYVDVQYFDGIVKRIRAERAAEATLDWVPPWLGRRMELLADLDAARCVLVPLVPPGLLDGVDPARAGLDRLPTIRETFKTIDDRSIAWTLSPYPTRGWAELVYPGLDADAALERLWRDVAHVCRLDEPDPAEAWHDRIEQIFQVASRLDALDLDALRFEGPGTDLTVGLLPSSRFAKEGGSSQTRTGVRHVPNLPTEEVYTTPDPRRTEGVVAATKPLDVAGSLVTGLRVRFEGGRAVSIDAETNADALRGRCAVDEGASRLGEVALVDRESRIGKLGRTFFTTLLDENAASHLALGDAYSSPIADDADLPHINESAVHIDFMIGSDDVAVTGTTRSGAQVPILRGGAWQI
jgi:aminopeptidase